MMSNQSHQSSRGFTFIELLVVTTIIMVLAAIGAVSFIQANRSSRDAKRKTDLEVIRQALVLYRSDTGCYPNLNGNASGLSTTISSYLSPIPSDPVSANYYTYTSAGGTASCRATFAVTATLEDESTYTVRNP